MALEQRQGTSHLKSDKGNQTLQMPYAKKKKRHRPLRLQEPQMHSLKPHEWIGGIYDAHWDYSLIVSNSANELLSYKCRFSTLHDIYNTMLKIYHVRDQLSDTSGTTKTRAAPPAFPPKHYLGCLTKYMDSQLMAAERADSILQTLSFFESSPETKKHLHELVACLPKIGIDAEQSQK